MTRALVITAVVLASAAAARAVKTELWVENQPAQLEQGEFDGTVSSSLGRIRLNRSKRQILADRADVDYVHALVEGTEGTVFAGTGPSGIVLQLKDQTVTELFKAPDGGNVWSLLVADGQLLAGVDGSEAVIHAIDLGDGTSRVFAKLNEAHYVWAMVRASDGTIYAATGPEGKLFALDSEGKTTLIYDCQDNNLLCLAIDSAGMLYVGTDGRGLVLRIDPGTSKAFVLYDAPEDEVGAILIGDKGEVYAGTAAADQAKPGRKLSLRPGGRPEVPAAYKSHEQQFEDDNTLGTGTTTKPARPTSVGRPPTAAKPGKKKVTGNAIYRIVPTGFVTEVFRESVMVLALVQADGCLIVGTGNEGLIYSVAPAEEEVAVLANLGSAQVASLVVAADGEIYAGTDNAAGVYALSAGYTDQGTFISRVLDAKQVCRWGQARVWADTPAETSISMAFRCGNLDEPDEQIWSNWSDDLIVEQTVPVLLPLARFLQYRLTLQTRNSSVTPVVEKVRLARLEDNRAPMVRDLKVAPAAKKGAKSGRPPGGSAASGPVVTTPQEQWLIKWQADDPNNDRLIYDVYFRQTDSKQWIRMAEELSQPQHPWNTRTVADGLYEIRVVAKDLPDNPPGSALSAARISDVVVVDNSPPAVAELNHNLIEPGKLRVRAVLTDRWTNIRTCHYSIDSNDEWTVVLPVDGIFDSRRETVSFEVDELKSGDHRIAIRVLDAQHNSRYEVLSIEITLP